MVHYNYSLAQGRNQWDWWHMHEIHSNLSEDVSFRRVIRLAERKGSPVYFVHVSAREGVEAVGEARSRGPFGLPASANVSVRLDAPRHDDFPRRVDNLDRLVGNRRHKLCVVAGSRPQYPAGVEVQTVQIARLPRQIDHAPAMNLRQIWNRGGWRSFPPRQQGCPAAHFPATRCITKALVFPITKLLSHAMHRAAGQLKRQQIRFRAFHQCPGR